MDYDNCSNEQGENEKIEEIVVNEENIEESDERQMLCALCNEQEKDLSENNMSVLCYKCRKQKLKLNIPLKIKVFLSAIGVVFLCSMVMFIFTLSNYQRYLSAEKHMENKEFSLAYYKYSTVLEKYSYSVPIILKTAEAAMSAQYFGNLAETLNTYLLDKNLNDNEYKIVMEYSDFLDVYFDTYQEIDDIITEMNNTFDKESDPSEISKFIHGKLEELLLKDDIDKSQVYYNLYVTSETIEEAFKYSKLLYEQNPRTTYGYASYGNVLRRMGEFDQAKQVFQKAIDLNACDALSWRGKGVIQLLENQKKSGLESIKYAYKIEPDGLFVKEALVIALCENGLRDDAMTFLENFNNTDYKIEEDLQGYLDGTISVEQYFLN